MTPATERPHSPSPSPPAPGSARAHERLRGCMHEHYDAIWRALRRFGVPAAHVEDAAQQVFIVLANHLDQVKEGSERAYLYGCAVRVASGVRKHLSRSREVASALEADDHPGPDFDAEAILDARRARMALDDVLAAMPMDLRTVFVLYELEELTMAEIAASLDIPPGTVASRLRRARELFASCVSALKERRGARSQP
ncbi:RNA polymerase sigma factor [Pendulispora albinea]|uniref:Sigma-70 family RNA polymerase sigma factor n=1 Tax=Pendulispora albinea TaxID=2741071 RepID=A0ABZ2MBB6_9BACT